MPSRTDAVRAPQQRRSQETLDRILDATERLLLKRRFESLSIQEIVRASGASVGAFYNRFRDKESLIRGLYDRHDAGLGDWIKDWRGRQGEPPADLVQAAAWVTRYLIDTFQARRHLLRSLALLVRAHPEAEEGAQARRTAQHRFLVDALLAHRDQILHPEPERAVQAAVFGAASICRERILFSEGLHAQTTVQSNAQLLQDVTSMIVGLLRPVHAADLARS
ncbi:MAG: TetR/AcrR family transcriptional regulator [Planctomycetota bacterium]